MAHLSEIERVVFALSTRMFFVPLHYILGLDYELICSRATDLEVKTIIPRKVHIDGHMADIFADSLFNSLLAVKFRRRGDGQEVGICVIMYRLR